MTTRDRIRRWHSPALFTLIAFCFMLPFLTVSYEQTCDLVGPCSYGGSGKTSFTGIELVTHAVPRGTGTGACPGPDSERTYVGAAINTCVEDESAIPAEIAFGAAVVGLVLGLLGVAGGPGWFAAAGLGALFASFVSLATSNHFLHWPHAGYWLAVALFAWAGILHFRRWRSRKASAWELSS